MDENSNVAKFISLPHCMDDPRHFLPVFDEFQALINGDLPSVAVLKMPCRCRLSAMKGNDFSVLALYGVQQCAIVPAGQFLIFSTTLFTQMLNRGKAFRCKCIFDEFIVIRQHALNWPLHRWEHRARLKHVSLQRPWR